MKLVFQSGPRAGQDRRVEPGQAIVIGRDQDCDVPLDDTRVSRRHARLRVDATGTATVEDLGSTNGTFVNGRRIEGATVVHEGDSISIGNSRTTLAGDAAAVGGASTVVVPSARPSAGLTVIRTSLARANRTARLAIGIAVLVLIVAVVGAAVLLTGRPATNEEVVAKLRPSVVRVEARTPRSTSTGTGWVLDADKGLIVTNNHVIAGGQTVQITGEGVTPRSANIIAAAPCEDLAVIHVDDKAGLVTSQLGSQAALRQGDDVLAIGYPRTASAQPNLVVTTGTVAVVKTTFKGGGDLNNLPNVVLTSAKVNSGNSGGPLVNRSGQVVGVNSITNSTRDENWAIGIDRVKEVIPTLSAGQGMGWTGMSFEDYGGDSLQRSAKLSQYGLPDEPGLVVIDVAPNTAAADRLGSGPFLITAIDKQPMDGSLPTYCTAVSGKANGSTSTYSIVFPAGPGKVIRSDEQLTYR